jgi:hypothetical protein
VSKFDSQHDLTAEPLTSAAPQISTSRLGRVHTLHAEPLTTKPRELGGERPPDRGVHLPRRCRLIWSKDRLSRRPSRPKRIIPLRKKDCIMPTTHLTTEPLTVGSPEIGTVSLGVVHVLQAEPLTIGMPPTGVHQLKAAPMRALSRAKFTIELIRPPLALVTASPQIGTPAVGQIHVLRAEPLHTEPPEIVERRGVHRLHVQPSRRTRKSGHTWWTGAEPYCGSVCGRNASQPEKNCRTATI